MHEEVVVFDLQIYKLLASVMEVLLPAIILFLK